MPGALTRGILWAWAWTWSRTTCRPGASASSTSEAESSLYHELPRAGSATAVQGSHPLAERMQRVLPRGARPLRRRRARVGVGDAVPGGAGAGAAGGSLGRGRHLRRARGHRRAPGSASGGGHVLRREQLPARRPVPPRRLLLRARAATARSAPTTSAACSRWRASSCEVISRRTCAASSRRSSRGSRAAGSPSCRRSCAAPGASTCAAAGASALHLELASGPVARRAFSLLRSYGVPCEIRTYRRRAFEQGTRFQIHLEDDARALQALNEAGVLDANLVPLERPPRRVVARPCCRAAYLRGAFLAAGSASGPRNAHLELRTADADSARLLAELAAAEGFALAVYERSGHAVAYAKGTETIADFLAFLGAQDAALRLGEEAVVVGDAGPREPAGERRPRQHRPHEPCRGRPAPGDPPAGARGQARRAGARARRDRAPARPPPDAVAARAGPPLRPARDEGGRPPPPDAHPAAGSEL